MGVFLDPPYRLNERSEVYAHEVDDDLHDAIQGWCRENEALPGMRIVVAGYNEDFDLPGWRTVWWRARRAMGNSSGETRNSANRGRERAWLSPGCVGGLGAEPI
jgi:hypothetical protein